MTDVRRVIRPNRRRFVFGSAGGVVSYALGLSPTLSQPLHATARIMVGFPQVAPTTLLRTVAEQMKAYASSTIVENRPGAGGRVVMDVLKNSAADGSVMVLTPAVAVALYPHVYKSLSYNPQRDFAPVTTISTTSMLIAIGPLVPGTVKTLADFIAWCRSNPNHSSYGSPGAGSPLHFLGVMLSRAANFEYLHVPFQGTAPSIKVCWAVKLPPASRRSAPSFHTSGPGRCGRWQRRAHSAARCCPMCQPLPRRDTRRSNSPNGSAFCSGADSQRDRRDASSVLRAALQTKEMQAGLANQSVDVGGLTPADFARPIKADTDRWGRS